MTYYEDDTVTLYHGDCIEVMRGMAEASVDAIVTDPPYGLGFMGRAWDALPPGYDFAVECLRVLKPGGHMLAFGGTRTWHRLACAIEDAGFEVRDSIAWMYGSGFPKSLDVSKAIDKRGGAVASFAEFRDAVKDAMQENGVSRSRLQDVLGNYMLSHYLTAGSQPAVPNVRDYLIIRDTVGLGSGFDHLFKVEAEREVVGQKQTGDPVSWFAEAERGNGLIDITAPATPDAVRWQGWGTALKPAFEPIVVARKPLIGTVAANVLAYGTGALNVDGCRVGTGGHLKLEQPRDMGYHGGSDAGSVAATESALGRWPANVILDESQAKNLGEESRFFYTAKASTGERPSIDGAAHPTVKPLNLMRHLVRLVTPPGGIVLEPFAGSGTTLEACIVEGFKCIGIERDPTYLELIVQRVSKPIQVTLL
jgi:site-specific DNA-methyltransferase (adenine-specific)